MSIRELIDYYKSILNTAEHEGMSDDVVSSTISVLERMEQKAVVYHDSEFKTICCPNCGKSMVYEHDPMEMVYCYDCGQFLGWEKVEPSKKVVSFGESISSRRVGEIY